jgi:hypothetical protein
VGKPQTRYSHSGGGAGYSLCFGVRERVAQSRHCCGGFGGALVDQCLWYTRSLTVPWGLAATGGAFSSLPRARGASNHAHHYLHYHFAYCWNLRPPHIGHPSLISCTSNVNTRWGNKSVAIPPAYMEEPAPHKRPVASRSVILPV